MIVILLINATNNREDITALHNIAMGWEDKHEIADIAKTANILYFRIAF